MPRHVEIVGAGFAGMTAAVAFAQRGWSVRLHERASEPRAFGAGIFLWENGLRVLEAVGALGTAMAQVHEAPHYWVKDQDGNLLRDYVFGPDVGTRMVTMTRQNLHSALLKEVESAGVELVCDSHVVRAHQDGSIETETGRRYQGDLVVGADGVNSKVRDSLDLVERREYTGHGAIRLMVPRTSAEKSSIDGNAVVFTQDGKSARRLLQVPCDQNELYLCFGMATHDESGRSIPVNKEAWIDSFPRLQDMIERIGDQGRWDEYQTIKLKNWTAGRVAIIGDAAHSMTPSLGQGAGCAMMNGLSLAHMVADGADVIASLKHWEHHERGLTDHTQDYASLITEGGLEFKKWTDDALRAALHKPVGWQESVGVH